MLKAKVIQNDKGQAILLPKEFQVNQEELFLNESDGVVFLCPTNDQKLTFEKTAGIFSENFLEERNNRNYDPWLPLRLSIGQMSEDFMEERNQPSWDEVSAREDF